MTNSSKGSVIGKDYAEKLDRLLRFLYDTEESKPEEVKEVLASYGINPEELVTEGMQFIRSLEKKERVKIAHAKRKRLAEVFHQLKSIDARQPIDAVRKRVDEILKGDNDSQFALAFYHKYDSLSEEDLRNLLSDAELLNLLEEELKKLDRLDDE
jgi:hypothetical protein